jgi:hypothetical protein
VTPLLTSSPRDPRNRAGRDAELRSDLVEAGPHESPGPHGFASVSGALGGGRRLFRFWCRSPWPWTPARTAPSARLLSRGAEKAAHHCRQRLSIITGIHRHSARHLESPYCSGSGRSRRDLPENENRARLEFRARALSEPGENPKTDKAFLIGNQAKIVQPGSMALGAPSISDAA